MPELLNRKRVRELSLPEQLEKAENMERSYGTLIGHLEIRIQTAFEDLAQTVATRDQWLQRVMDLRRQVEEAPGAGEGAASG